MKYYFTRVPVIDGEAAAAALNQFLGAHRVVDVQRDFVADGARSFWAFCVTWLETPAAPQRTAPKGNAKIDYREVLPEAQFEVFAELRALRKTLAEADGVPVYGVFTNEQLAEMVRRPVTSLAEMEALDGVGPARISKYGQQMLAVLTREIPARTVANGES